MKKSTVLLHNLDQKCAHALDVAICICHSWKHDEIIPEHFLLGLIEGDENDITFLSQGLEWELEALRQDLLAFLCRLPKKDKEQPILSKKMIILLNKACTIASEINDQNIQCAHILIALAENRKLLNDYGMWLPIKLLTEKYDNKNQHVNNDKNNGK
jgi:type VI secretion system protein VasG